MGVVGQMGQDDRKKWRKENPKIWDANYLEIKKAKRDAINKRYGLKK